MHPLFTTRFHQSQGAQSGLKACDLLGPAEEAHDSQWAVHQVDQLQRLDQVEVEGCFLSTKADVLVIHISEHTL